MEEDVLSRWGFLRGCLSSVCHRVQLAVLFLLLLLLLLLLFLLLLLLLLLLIMLLLC